MSGSDGGFDQDQSIEEQIARLVVSDTDPLAKRIEGMGGTPYGMTHLTPNIEDFSWDYTDDSINPDQLRAAGMKESEIEMHAHPLRPQIMSQAGRSFDAQMKKYQQMTERALRRQAAGRTPKPPQRSGGIHQAPFEPVKEY